MRKGTLKAVSRGQANRSGARWERQLIRHARNRLGERYGLHIGTDEYWAIVRRIQALAGEPEPVRLLYRADRITTWHLVRVQERPVIALYDARIKRVRTFLALVDLALIGLKLEDVA